MDISSQKSGGDHSPNTSGTNHAINTGANGIAIQGEVHFHAETSKISEEVSSIAALITLLTEKAIAEYTEQDGDDITVKDIHAKLDRFAPYKARIQAKYVELVGLYDNLYDKVIKEIDPSPGRTKMVRVYLKGLSERQLEVSDDDPLVALNHMVDFFEKEICKMPSEQLPARTAIEYFLLKELINCNLFPNPVE